MWQGADVHRRIRLTGDLCKQCEGDDDEEPEEASIGSRQTSAWDLRLSELLPVVPHQRTLSHQGRQGGGRVQRGTVAEEDRLGRPTGGGGVHGRDAVRDMRL